MFYLDFNYKKILIEYLLSISCYMNKLPILMWIIFIFIFLKPEFLKAKCLMNCEVALILERKYDQLQQMSDDPLNQVSQ